MASEYERIGTTYAGVKRHKIRRIEGNVWTDYETHCGCGGYKLKPGQLFLPKCKLCFRGEL